MVTLPLNTASEQVIFECATRYPVLILDWTLSWFDTTASFATAVSLVFSDDDSVFADTVVKVAAVPVVVPVICSVSTSAESTDAVSEVMFEVCIFFDSIFCVTLTFEKIELETFT